MALAEGQTVQTSGPGNRPIVAMLQETLVRRGRLADRERAANWISEAVGDEAALPLWIDSSLLGRLWELPSVDDALARSMGNRLVSPDSVGMPLYALGLATPEKAFRRLQSLLPREARAARWSADEIAGEAAELSYEPGPDELAEASGLRAGCALRRGMLESVPTLYGLLPAKVEESACLARGDSTCRYRVVWSREQRRGLIAGASAGLVCGVVFGLSGIGLGAISAGPASFCAAWITILGAALGRGIDLAAQLEAVAGARRGQLALFDQVDDQLASKLDALARADAKLEETPTAFRVGVRESERIGESPVHSESVTKMTEALSRIFALSGDLECWFEEQKPPKKSSSRRRREAAREQLRTIRETAKQASLDGVEGRRAVDLRALVARSVASLRPTLPDPERLEIEIAVSENAKPFVCDPIEMEELIGDLVRNAVEASRAVGATPHARIVVQDYPTTVEVAIEDQGRGDRVDRDR